VEKKIKHLVLVLDRSGSMATIVQDAEGGVASLLADQRKADAESEWQTIVTLVQFDDQIELLTSREPVERVSWRCKPRGMTALLDAVGTTVAGVLSTDETEELAPVPEQTVLVIVTDGMENASTEYNTERTKEVMDRATKAGWTTIFLGANQDAWAFSDGIGIDRRFSAQYAASPEGTRSAYASASGMVANSAPGGRGRSFTEQDREDAMDED